jgi:hypothetical protein
LLERVEMLAGRLPRVGEQVGRRNACFGGVATSRSSSSAVARSTTLRRSSTASATASFTASGPGYDQIPESSRYISIDGWIAATMRHRISVTAMA